jgi:hypothetical protein
MEAALASFETGRASPRFTGISRPSPLSDDPLHKAQVLMVTGVSAAEAARRVGYERFAI